MWSSQFMGFPALSQIENQNLAFSLNGLTCSFHPGVLFPLDCLPADPPDDHERDSPADSLIAFRISSMYSSPVALCSWISQVGFLQLIEQGTLTRSSLACTLWTYILRAAVFISAFTHPCHRNNIRSLTDFVFFLKHRLNLPQHRTLRASWEFLNLLILLRYTVTRRRLQICF